MNYKSRKKLKEALKTAQNWIEHLEKENHELFEKNKAILRGDRVVTPACDVCKFSVKSKNTFIGFESTYCSLDCKCKDFEQFQPNFCPDCGQELDWMENRLYGVHEEH